MINVTQPFLPNLNKYHKYLEKIYENSWLTNNGPLVKELNVRLCEYLGVKNLVLVSSGTMALNISYKLLNIQKSVITTPFSFVATTSSLVWNGIDPVFSDIDPLTFNLNPDRLHSCMSESIEAILPVHVFGNPCDMEGIQNIAKYYNKKLIYDASHAFGVKHDDRSVLTYGDLSILSFHATKLFHTIEGGAIVVNDDRLFDEANRLLNFGYNQRNEIVTPGINGKMSEFHAAMGLAVLDDIDLIISKRKEIHDYYYRKLNDVIELQAYNLDATRNYSYMPVVFKTEEKLIEVLKTLNRHEIFPRRYFNPSLDTLCYVDKIYNCDHSQDISRRILCLPIYDSLSIKDVQRVIQCIKDCHK